MEAIERLRFLASFGPPSTGNGKGGEKMQPFNRSHSRPSIVCQRWLPKTEQIRIQKYEAALMDHYANTHTTRKDKRRETPLARLSPRAAIAYSLGINRMQMYDSAT